MPRVGSEPTIPVSERAKTVHASDHAAIVTGFYIIIVGPNEEGYGTILKFLRISNKD
jgi:hypothetical protein